MGSILRQENISDLIVATATTLQLPASTINIGGAQFQTDTLTLDTTISGAGGIDNGSYVPLSRYHVYAVIDTTPKLIASLNPPSVGPMGFTFFRSLDESFISESGGNNIRELFREDDADYELITSSGNYTIGNFGRRKVVEFSFSASLRGEDDITFPLAADNPGGLLTIKKTGGSVRGFWRMLTQGGDIFNSLGMPYASGTERYLPGGRHEATFRSDGGTQWVQQLDAKHNEHIIRREVFWDGTGIKDEFGITDSGAILTVVASGGGGYVSNYRYMVGRGPLGGDTNVKQIEGWHGAFDGAQRVTVICQAKSGTNTTVQINATHESTGETSWWVLYQPMMG